MDHRHLWLRSSKQHAIMLVRNEIIRATYEFFNEQGFIKIDSPILTGSAPEGTTELFETDYFGQPAFLSQTGQLYAKLVRWHLEKSLLLDQLSVRKIQNSSSLNGILDD